MTKKQKAKIRQKAGLPYLEKLEPRKKNKRKRKLKVEDRDGDAIKARHTTEALSLQAQLDKGFLPAEKIPILEHRLFILKHHPFFPATFVSSS